MIKYKYTGFQFHKNTEICISVLVILFWKQTTFQSNYTIVLYILQVQLTQEPCIMFLICPVNALIMDQMSQLEGRGLT